LIPDLNIGVFEKICALILFGHFAENHSQVLIAININSHFFDKAIFDYFENLYIFHFLIQI
jgi:hypothetical protein